jgi:hypothetical protein
MVSSLPVLSLLLITGVGKRKDTPHTQLSFGYDIHIHAWLGPRDIGNVPCLRVNHQA